MHQRRDFPERARSNLYFIIAREAAKLGLLEEAQAAAARITNPRDQEEIHSQIAWKLIRQGRTKEGVDLAIKLENDQPRRSLILGYARLTAGQVSEAMRILPDGLDTGRWYAGYIDVIIEELIRRDAVAKFLEIVRQRKGEFTQRSAAGAVIRALARAGRLDEAAKIELPKSSDSIDRSQLFYEEADDLANRGRTTEALAIAPVIEDPGYRRMAYVSVAKALAQREKGAEALQAVSRIDLDQRPPSELLKIAKLLAEKGDPTAFDIVELVEEEEGSEPIKSYVEVADLLAKHVGPRVLDAAERIPYDRSRAKVLVIVAGALLAAGEVQDATRAVEGAISAADRAMREGRMRAEEEPTFRAALAEVLVGLGNFYRARRYCESSFAEQRLAVDAAILDAYLAGKHAGHGDLSRKRESR